MSPEAYAQVMEKRLLIITKANSRSTVHRAAYLDYIGFKIFDARRQHRRRAAVPRSVQLGRVPAPRVRDLPVVKRKVAEVRGRAPG